MKEREVSNFKEALKQAIVIAVDSKRLTTASQIVVRRAFPLLSTAIHYHPLPQPLPLPPNVINGPHTNLIFKILEYGAQIKRDDGYQV